MYNFLSIKVYMDPSSKKPIQEVSELLKQLKKDISEMKDDVKYIKNNITEKDEEAEIIVQPISSGWW